MSDDFLSVPTDDEVERARAFWQKLGHGNLVLGAKDYYEAVLAARRIAAEKQAQDRMARATWVLAAATVVLAVATVALIFATLAS